jgi:type IV pilus assembly protein PilA
MIVVAIIGILASIAIPAYSDYTVRAKVTEGLNLADSAKTAVSEGFQSNGLNGVNSASVAFAAGFTSTKYVSSVAIATGTGVITVQYGGNTTVLSGLNLKLQPQIQIGGAYSTLAAVGATTNSGSIDWSCASTTATTATTRNPVMLAPALGTVPARYVPTECK